MKRKNFSALILGLVFLIFGGGYVAARLLGYDPVFFFDGWWTLFLIVPAVITMIETGVHLGNVIILTVGLLLLAWKRDWIENLNFPMVLAVLLVIFGGYLIAKAFSGSRKEADSRCWNSSGEWNADDVNMPAYSSFFNGVNVKNLSQNLMGGSCNASLGQLRVDLSEAVVTHDVTIFCNAILGQVVVRAPKNVRIICKNVPILGGVQLHADSLPSNAQAPAVVFDCTCILGGVSIQ